LISSASPGDWPISGGNHVLPAPALAHSACDHLRPRLLAVKGQALGRKALLIVKELSSRRSFLTLRDRKEEGITFAEISIPPKRMVQETKRDQIEAEFLKWRTGEMKRRYQKTIDRLQKK
jgi:hypothetical protein